MTKTYEGMFLLDNRVVRENWNVAKAIVTDLLEKHGGKVLTARRWDERQLAYPIKKRNRATFMLAYYEIGSEGITTLRRDLDLSEQILRYLLLAVDAVPEGETELAEVEQTEEFTVPTPPEDHVKDEVPEEEDRDSDRGPRRRRDDDGERSERSERTDKADTSAEPSEDSAPADEAAEETTTAKES